MSTTTIAVLSVAVALVITPVAIVVAQRTGITDRPGALKSQSVAVPYLGGVAVFCGTAVGVLTGRPSILIPLAAALVLGVADDRFDLPAAVRLVGELGIGLLVVVASPVRFAGLIALVSVVVVTVVVINGVNLIDGLDLLAGGVAVAAAVGFAVVLHGPGRQVAVALGGAVAGFLVFNRPPARIYLGDGGAYLIGATLAVLVTFSWAPHLPVATGVAALALIALPAAEIAFAIVRRRRGRRSLMAGDRGHPYDHLVRRGWGRPAVSLTYFAVEAACAAAVIVVVHAASLAAAVVLDVVVALLLVGGALLTGALTPDQEVTP